MKTTLLLVTCLAVAGCAKEKGRVAFSADGTATTSVTLEAGDVDFWTDIDAEWSGAGSMQYEVELEQSGVRIASTTCDPLAHLSVKMSWVETNLGDSHSRSGKGKMGCSVKVPTAGATTVKVTLTSAWPAKATLTKADLLVKQ